MYAVVLMTFGYNYDVEHRTADILLIREQKERNAANKNISQFHIE